MSVPKTTAAERVAAAAVKGGQVAPPPDDSTHCSCCLDTNSTTYVRFQDGTIENRPQGQLRASGSEGKVSGGLGFQTSVAF